MKIKCIYVGKMTQCLLRNYLVKVFTNLINIFLNYSMEVGQLLAGICTLCFSTKQRLSNLGVHYNHLRNF